MYDSQIEGMTRRIAEALLLDKEKIAATRQALTDYWRGAVAITWRTEDIIEGPCNDEDSNWPGRALTEEQAAEVLSDLQHHFDASIGINWDVIDTTIRYYLHEDHPGD